MAPEEPRQIACVWLVFYKKSLGKPTVIYDEAVEETPCYGWIDSLMKPVDDEKYRQLFTPRKPKSRWSRHDAKRPETRLRRITEAVAMAAEKRSF